MGESPPSQDYEKFVELFTKNEQALRTFVRCLGPDHRSRNTTWMHSRYSGGLIAAHGNLFVSLKTEASFAWKESEKNNDIVDWNLLTHKQPFFCQYVHLPYDHKVNSMGAAGAIRAGDYKRGKRSSNGNCS